MIDERLSREIEVGARSRPRYSTDVITTDGGHEFRNSRWAFPLFEFEIDLEPGDKDDEAFLAVLDLFHAAGGTHETFRFRHWRDYQASNQPIAVGNGVLVEFQLYRVYTSGSTQRRRKITRPVEGSVTVYVNAVEDAGATVDYETGLITTSTAPAAGQIVAADFEYDIPVRFADDSLEIASLTDVLDQIATVILMEVRE